MRIPKHIRGVSGFRVMATAWIVALLLAAGASIAQAEPLSQTTPPAETPVVPQPTTGVAVPNAPGASDAVPGGAPQANQPAGQPGQPSNGVIQSQPAVGAAPQQEPLAPPIVFPMLLALLFGIVLVFSFRARQDALR